MTFASPDVRRGPTHWLHSYRSMLRFEIANLRVYLTIALLIQMLMGAGMALMYGFYLGDLPATGRLWLVTGIPALALFPVGFVILPNVIMQHKLQDTYDFVWSLPVSRMASAASTFTVFTLLSVPGTLLALAIAWWRYDVDLTLSWAFVPALLLVSLMGTSVGFSVGHSIPNPMITNLLTNILIFAVLLFTPIVIPIDLFPGWLAGLHTVLPFYHMAEVLRASLSNGLVENVAQSYLVVVIWTVAAWTLVAWVVGRRR